MKFSERLAQLGFASYADYLASDVWKGFRARYKEAGKRMTCEVCSAKPIQLHHQNYDRLGNEWFEDVVPVCDQHHKAIHQWLKTSGRIFVGYTSEAIRILKGGPIQLPAARAKSSKKAKRKLRTRRQRRTHSCYVSEKTTKTPPIAGGITRDRDEAKRAKQERKRLKNAAHQDAVRKAKKIVVTASVASLMVKLNALTLTPRQRAASERFLQAEDAKQLAGLIKSIMDKEQEPPRPPKRKPYSISAHTSCWRNYLTARHRVKTGDLSPTT